MAALKIAKQATFTAAQIAAAMAPVPQANVVYNVIRDIIRQCDSVKVHKEKVQQLSDRVEKLREEFKKHQQALSRTTLANSVEQLLRSVEDIRENIRIWSSYGWLQSYVRSREISKGLDLYCTQLEEQLQAFNNDTGIQTLGSLQDQNELLLKLNAASYQDDTELIVNGECMSRVRFEALYLRLQDTMSRIEKETGKNVRRMVPEITERVAIDKSASGLLSGVHAEVLVGYYLGNTKVAVKKLRFIPANNDKNILRFLNEFKVWTRVGPHPHILRLMGFIKVAGQVALVSPFMSNGNLRNFCCSRRDAERLHLLAGAANGLAFLHSTPAVHGNMKAFNILVNDQLEAVIFDFEMSKVIKDIGQETNVADTLTRSPSYRWTAPEVGFSNRRLDDKSDIWAFGMVMLEVFTLNVPFPEIRREETVLIYVAREGLRPSRPDSDWVTDEVWALMQDCYKDCEERPSMGEVERCLRKAEQDHKEHPLATQPTTSLDAYVQGVMQC